MERFIRCFLYDANRTAHVLNAPCSVCQKMKIRTLLAQLDRTVIVPVRTIVDIDIRTVPGCVIPGYKGGVYM